MRWRSEPREETRCEACREIRPEEALDERRWCSDCRKDLDRLERWGQHVTALAITIPFGVWIVLEEQFGVLPGYAWLLPLAAAYYLGFRIGRELVKGYVRWRRVRS